ncbi:U18-myrmicitoxin-Mri1a-like [Lineus longissimus]|uniref:U18-myrmicitoxin-Mri1a-like n=1 Tax=Lineus longissimus TaxID=88925 RepID=UPI002B4D0EE0
MTKLILFLLCGFLILSLEALVIPEKAAARLQPPRTYDQGPSPTDPNRTKCQPKVIHTYCFNRGTCFAVKSGEKMQYGCVCQSGWTGYRCSEVNLNMYRYMA